MLKKLLDLMTQEGVIRPADLAKRLDTTPEIIEQAIETLVQRGYLKRVEGCASTGCHSCLADETCTLPRMWTVRRPASG